MENHPQIRVRMINVVGSRGRETEEQPKLNDDQHQGKYDARQRHRKPHSVVKQVPSC